MSTKCKFMYGMVANNFLLAAYCLELNPFSPVGNLLSMEKTVLFFYTYVCYIFVGAESPYLLKYHC